MVHCKLVGSVVLCLAVSLVAAAEDVAPPKQPPLIMLDFGDAALVEMAITDVPSITFVTSRSNRLTRTRTVPVTSIRQETRTRTVVVDGKPVEQSYVVSVPFTTNVQQTYTADEPSVNEPTTIPIAKIAAWDLSGKKIDPADLAVRVSEPTAAVLLKQPWRTGASIEPSHLALLRDDVVFLYSAELNKSRFRIIPEQAR